MFREQILAILLLQNFYAAHAAPKWPLQLSECALILRELGHVLPIDSLFKRISVDPTVLDRFQYVDVKTRSKVENLGSGMQVHHGYLRLHGYLETLDKISSKIDGKKRGALNKVEVAVYPFSGSDAMLPLTLFPKAKVYILLDNHVFANASQEAFKYTIPKESSGFRDWREVAKSNSLGSQVLSNLAVSVPGLRIRQIELLEEKKTKFRGSAIILFDRGENTPVQTLIYSGKKIGKNETLDSQWWAPQVIGKSLGITLKGSMDLTGYKFWDDLSGQAESSPSSIIVSSNKELDLTHYKRKQLLLSIPDITFGYREGMFISKEGGNGPRSGGVNVFVFK